MPLLHTINAHLYENLLTKNDSADYLARTISEESLNIKQICEAAVNRGGADMSAPSMEYAVTLFLKEMAYQLCDGFTINTGYFTAGTKIKGVFNSLSETFDKDKHKIFFQFNQGERMRAMIPDIQVNILGAASRGSVIYEVTDMKSGSINNKISPGRNLNIKGAKIKIAGDSPENGIFFVNSVTNNRTIVPADDIIVNKASELIIIIPELEIGSYYLEVTSQYSGSNLLKASRTAGYDKVLSVE